MALSLVPVLYDDASQVVSILSISESLMEVSSKPGVSTKMYL